MKGFTLIELITTFSTIFLLLFLGLPFFTNLYKEIRLDTSTHILLESIEAARALAVFNNQRALILPKSDKWEDGWIIFLDLNDDGKLNENEHIVRKIPSLNGVSITANAPLKDYISFIGSGEGRKIGKPNGGAMLIGTLKVCSMEGGTGHSLTISRGGRTRLTSLSITDCPNTI